MKKVLIGLMLVFMVTGFVSCEWREDVETGKKHIRIDPNEAGKYEDAAEGSIGIMTALSPLFPFLIPVITGVGGALGIWRRLKPKLTASEEEKNNFVRGGEVLAMVLEELKTEHPDIWKDVGPKIEVLIKNSTLIENAIRGFRHLAPK